MRIAYITPYQGPTVIKRRPIIRNRSLSMKLKIELIAQFLRSSSHDVEVFSHGEVVENSFKLYRAFEEPERFHSEIPVYYISALPIRRLNGLWSSARMLSLVKRRHHLRQFDLAIIYNLKRPQITCAKYLTQNFRIPVILEYEDDAFVDIGGKSPGGLVSRFHRAEYAKVINAVSGCIGVSPHLLSQLPQNIPKMLLRGAVGDDVPARAKNSMRMNRVLFSGTHIESNGVAQLIEAWRLLKLRGWELHITGFGKMTDSLRAIAEKTYGTVFHGLVSRDELVGLMCSARICISPQVVSRAPGNVFPFKVVEYIAAGAHVITTPMGVLEPELEAAVTYMKDNSPEVIATTLKSVIENRGFERTASGIAHQLYGSLAVSKGLDLLISEIVSNRR